jgi:hypothetical protein
MGLPSRDTRVGLTGLLAVLAFGAAGCSTLDRNLKLTEVGKRQVEIFMDEAAAERLTLGDDMRLMVSWYDGGSVQTREIGLGALGRPVPGGSFVVVWEGGAYQGPPVGEDFLGGRMGSVAGIKVAGDFFGGIDAHPSEVRITGSRNRVSGLLIILPRFTTDRVEDVVRFGLPTTDRPATGGRFASDGSLGFPTGSASNQRRWSGGRPADTDAESDWMWGISSWGAPTP